MSSLPSREDMNTVEDDNIFEKQSESCEPLIVHEASSNSTQVNSVFGSSLSSPDEYIILSDSVDMNSQKEFPDSGKLMLITDRNGNEESSVKGLSLRDFSNGDSTEKSSVSGPSQREFFPSIKEIGNDGLMHHPAGLETDLLLNEPQMESLLQEEAFLPEGNLYTLSELELGEWQENNCSSTFLSSDDAHKIKDEMYYISDSTPVIKELGTEVEASQRTSDKLTGSIPIVAFEQSLYSESGKLIGSMPIVAFQETLDSASDNKEDGYVRFMLQENQGEGTINPLPQPIYPSYMEGVSVLKDGGESFGDSQTMTASNTKQVEIDVKSTDAVLHENQTQDMAFKACWNSNYDWNDKLREGELRLLAQINHPDNLDSEYLLVEGVTAETESLISSGSFLTQVQVQDDSAVARLSGSYSFMQKEHQVELAHTSNSIILQENLQYSKSADILLNESESMEHRVQDHNLEGMMLINGELDCQCGNMMQSTKIPINLETLEEKAERKELMEASSHTPVEPQNHPLLDKVSKDEGAALEPEIVLSERQEDGTLIPVSKLLNSSCSGRESSFGNGGVVEGIHSVVTSEAFVEQAKMDLETQVLLSNTQSSNSEVTILNKSISLKDALEELNLGGRITELKHRELENECEFMMQNTKVTTPSETSGQVADRKSSCENFPCISMEHVLLENVAKYGITVAEPNAMIHCYVKKDTSIAQEYSFDEMYMASNVCTTEDVNDQNIDNRIISEGLGSGFSNALNVNSHQEHEKVIISEWIGSLEEMETFVDAPESLETCSIVASVDDNGSLDGTNRSASENMELFLNANESETDFNEQCSEEAHVLITDSESEPRNSMEVRKKAGRLFVSSPDMREREDFGSGLRYTEIHSASKGCIMTSTFVEDLKAPSPEAWQETEAFEEGEAQNHELNQILIIESSEENGQTQKKLKKSRTPLRSLLAEEAETIESEQRISTPNRHDDQNPTRMQGTSSMEKPRPRSFWSHCICCPAVK